jgi:hypothetical protein
MTEANTLAFASKEERRMKTNSSRVKHSSGEQTSTRNASHAIRFLPHTFLIPAAIYPRFLPLNSHRAIAWHTHGTPKK